VVFNGQLYVFHQGQDASAGLPVDTFRGWLYVNVSSDGSIWAGDAQVPNTGLHNRPSAVVYDGKLHVFHRGQSLRDRWLWVNVFDGAAWAGDAQVLPKSGIAFGPSAVEFKGQLYVFHQGSRQTEPPPPPIFPDGDDCLWVNVFDGATWAGDAQVPGTTMRHGPSAVVYHGQLYVFHNSGGWLSVNVSSDGTTWVGDTPVPNTGLSFSPSAVVFNDQLYVFHNGQDGQWLWVNVYDGTTWAGDAPVPNTGLSFSPGAVVWGGS
jgi:hypothetical protein